MTKQIDSVIKQILPIICPTKDEHNSMKKELNNFLKKLNTEIKKKKIIAQVFVGGSFAKNTIVKKDSVEITIDELTKNNKLRMIIQIYAIWITVTIDETGELLSTFGIYLKPEIIEEKTTYNLNFIEEDKIIFESDDEQDNNSEDNSGEESD